MTTQPLRPDIACELLNRTERASENWTRLIRNQLDDIRLGRGRHADHENAKFLGRILADHGWPGHRLVGPDAARAAWRLALHADDQADFQQAAARLLHRAAQDRDAPLPQWAHLHDRALINLGQRQEYGTQHRVGAQGIELCPVQQVDTLDARRSAVGLPPLDTALQALRRRLAEPPGRQGVADDTVVLAVLADVA